jgi:hypothetical protein
MIEQLKKSQIISLQIENNLCAIGFYYELLNITQYKKALFVSSSDFSFIKSDIATVKPNFKSFENLHKNVDFLFFKDDIYDLVEHYSINNFENEFLSLSKTDYDVIFLHRIDLFSNISSTVFEKFLQNIKYSGKQVIYSYRKNFHLNINLDLSIKLDYTHSNCSMKIEKNNLNLALITNDQELINIHKKLFIKDSNIELKVLDYSDIFTKKEDRFNYVVYYEEDKILNKDRLTDIKTFFPNAKILYRINKDFIREYDIEEFKKMGVDEVLAKNFDIKKYVNRFEKYIGKNFYTDRVKAILNDKKELSHDKFLKYIEQLNKNHIIYNSIGVERDRIISDTKLSDFRKGDFYHYDKVHNMMVFVFLDVFKDGANKLLHKRLDLPKDNLKEFAR